MEDVMEKVQTKEHKGNYGNTKGRSANDLYKSYVSYCEDNNKKPLAFPDWIKWAKSKGVVPQNLNADAATDSNEEKAEDGTPPPVKSNIKKYTSVIIIGVSALLLYAAWKSDKTGN